MNRRMIRLTLVLLSAMLLALGAWACGDDDDDGDGGGDGDGGPSVVNVTLKEFEVLPEEDSVAAGDVTFKAKNTGPEDKHELVVIKTDLAPDALPTDDTGKVDEAGAGVEALGEIEEFDVDTEGELTLNLTAGKYVLICNIVEEEEGTTESHYQNGMRTAFTVN